jgi:hypothetical protein
MLLMKVISRLGLTICFGWRLRRLLLPQLLEEGLGEEF